MGIASIFFFWAAYSEPPVRNFHFVIPAGSPAYNAMKSEVEAWKGMQSAAKEMEKRYGATGIVYFNTHDDTAYKAAWAEFTKAQEADFGKPASVIMQRAGGGDNRLKVEIWKRLREEFDRTAPPVITTGQLAAYFRNEQEAPPYWISVSDRYTKMKALNVDLGGMGDIARVPRPDTREDRVFQDMIAGIGAPQFGYRRLFTKDMVFIKGRINFEAGHSWDLPSGHDVTAVKELAGAGYIVTIRVRQSDKNIAPEAIPQGAVQINERAARYLLQERSDTREQVQFARDCADRKIGKISTWMHGGPV